MVVDAKVERAPSYPNTRLYTTKYKLQHDTHKSKLLRLRKDRYPLQLVFTRYDFDPWIGQYRGWIGIIDPNGIFNSLTFSKTSCYSIQV